MALVHASCVAVAGTGVLIRGASGAGKSDLALRLIDSGATLVADDYCEVQARGGALLAQAPPAIAGKLEVRGLGLVEIPHIPTAAIGLVVDLLPERDIERMPESNDIVVEGVTLPRLFVDARSASAAAKVRLAATLAAEGLRVTTLQASP